MAKCDKCLKGLRPSITGIDKRTLKVDIGGAVIYMIPKADGTMEVSVNAQSLMDGDYLIGSWNGERWIVNTVNGKFI